jgi:hypothetical protein
MTREEWIEENRDALEKRYYQEYEMSLQDCFDGMDEAFKKFENALVDMGILEPDEEPEEDPEDMNSTEHWDEWAADQRYDAYRDLALMGYEK